MGRRRPIVGGPSDRARQRLNDSRKERLGGLPDHLKIGGSVVPVSYEELDVSEYGHFRQTPDPAIAVRDDMKRTTTLDTIFHEAIHAIDNRMGIGLKEDQVRRLDFAVLTLLRDNPEFAKELLSPQR